MPSQRMSGAERREQLLAVGRSIFAERGFEAASIEEIAARAGVSKPIVYSHFGGKDGLYAAVVDREIDGLHDSILRSLDARSARLVLEQAALALLTYIEDHPEGFRILVRDSRPGSRGTFASLLDDVVASVEPIVARIFRTNGFDTGMAAMYARALVGMVVFTGQWWLDARAPDRDTVAAHLVNIAWNGLERLDPTPELRHPGGRLAARRGRSRPSSDRRMTDRTLSLPGSGGVELAADAYGNEADPPVLLLHGGGQTRHSWHATASALADRGWRAYTVDLRGHGQSSWAPDGDYSLDAFAADVVAAAASLDQRPALVGASLGGVASLAAVGESPDPLATALVLVDVAPRIETAGADRIGAFMRSHMESGFATLEEAAEAVAAYNPHRPRPASLSGLEKNLRLRDDGRWVWHWDPRFMHGAQGGDETRVSIVSPDRLEAAARALRVPVLLVRGRVSDLLSEEGARQFLDLVPGAEYVDVEGAGHMVAGDRNDAFNDAIVGFLDSHRA